jgi:hypothetical protein
MNMQAQFDKDLNLIARHQTKNQIIAELLNHVFISEVSYSNGISKELKNPNKEYLY